MRRRSRALAILIACVWLAACGEPADSRAAGAPLDRAPLPACEWCGAEEAPEELDATMRIAGPDEPGERLVVTGTIYRPDGETPAAGVLLYAYHTNAEGIYPKRGDESGNARRHGHLRGWLRTGADGRYRIETIRPGAYPANTVPQHIHMTVKPPGEPEDWVDSVHFADDPLLTPERRRRLRNRGGSGVVEPRRDADGVWHARRDIVLRE